MKIYLDDLREPPPGYLLVKRVDKLKEIVREKGQEIEVLDLDNYLGEYFRFGGNGIDFILWLEEAVYTGEVKLNPNVKIISHSSDPVMRDSIEEVGRRIKAYLRSGR